MLWKVCNKPFSNVSVCWCQQTVRTQCQQFPTIWNLAIVSFLHDQTGIWNHRIKPSLFCLVKPLLVKFCKPKCNYSQTKLVSTIRLGFFVMTFIHSQKEVYIKQLPPCHQSGQKPHFREACSFPSDSSHKHTHGLGGSVHSTAFLVLRVSDYLPSPFSPSQLKTLLWLLASLLSSEPHGND